jgi:hypothetical protein
MVRLEPGLAGQAPLGSLWQEQTGGSRAKAKSKDKVLEMQCQDSGGTGRYTLIFRDIERSLEIYERTIKVVDYAKPRW